LVKILKDNKYYIIALLAFWVITLPYIFIKRDAIHNWFSLKVTSFQYSPSKMKSLYEKADSIIYDSITLSYIHRKCAQEKENSTECSLDEHLSMMRNACAYFDRLSIEKPPFEDTNWIEKKTVWTSDPEYSLGGLGSNRVILPKAINPQTYWKNHIQPVLSALEYYKKAQMVSGPTFTIVKKTQRAALASCRQQEGFMALINYIFSTENYILEYLQDEKKIPSYLSSAQQVTLVWKTIRDEKELREHLDPNDFVYSLQELLLPERGFRYKSPEEANEFFHRLLFFVKDDEWNENLIRFKWGKHLFAMGDENNDNYKRAILQLQASTVFSNSYTKLQSIEKLKRLRGHSFEANLITARAYNKLNSPANALQHLKTAERLLKTVDGRLTALVDMEMIKEYKATLRETYIAIGKPHLANSIEDE
jgi:hypothetical protein